MSRMRLLLVFLLGVVCGEEGVIGETDTLDDLPADLPDVEIENDVYVLTPETFDAFINAKELVMVSCCCHEKC